MTAVTKQDTWLVLVGCGVVRYSDGRLQRTARFGGPPLETASPAELVAMWAGINNTLRDLGPGWLFFVQTSRGVARRAPVVPVLSSGARLLLTEDNCAPDDGHSYYGNIYYLSFVWPWVKTNGWKSAAGEWEDQASADGAGVNASVARFIDRTNAVLRTIEGLVSETCWLRDEEVLSYSRPCMASNGQGIRRWFEIALTLPIFASCGAAGGLVL